MGFWDAVTGRTKQKPANLDSLFLVPSAALTLQTAAAFTPTGTGSVCYRGATGAGFQETQDGFVELLDSDEGAKVEKVEDSFGFTWLVAKHDPSDTAGLCTDLHAVNTALEEQGFGSGLLCTLVAFADASGRKVGLVYLYKQGTFYPFAPAGEDKRDNLLEIEIRDHLAAELPMEKELSRWLAVWGAPGL